MNENWLCMEVHANVEMCEYMCVYIYIYTM